MLQLVLARDSLIAARVSECGFDVFTRDNGLCPSGPTGGRHAGVSLYIDYLHPQGYDGDSPWRDYTNSGVNARGNMASGVDIRQRETDRQHQ